jgi:hypothetical protein
MISRMSWKNTKTITLTTSETTTPEIDMREAAGGFLEIVGDPTTLTFYGSSTVGEGATHVPIHDSTNTAVTLTVTSGKGYAIPGECFGCRSIKIKGASDAAIKYSLKG